LEFGGVFHIWQSAYKDQIIYPAMFLKAENEIQTKSSLLHEKQFPSLHWEIFYFLSKLGTARTQKATMPASSSFN